MMKRNKLNILILAIFTLFISNKIYASPQQAQVITTDVANFYKAFDLAVKDTANAQKIFNKHYFKKGSKGLKDFYKISIEDKKKFTKFVLRFQDFYRDIQPNVEQLPQIKKDIQAVLQGFKQLYPKTTLPNVYIVFGRFRTNGTVSKNGILIGAELYGKGNNVNTANWHPDIERISFETTHLPITVAHEMVHFNQGNLAEATTLLGKSIREGSAEFIAQFLTGQTDGDYTKHKAIETALFAQFKEERNKSVWTTWKKWHLGDDSKPKNSSYYMGYLVCKAYFEKHKQPKNIIDILLNIQDFEQFYQDSGIEE